MIRLYIFKCILKNYGSRLFKILNIICNILCISIRVCNITAYCRHSFL